jgi:hypothetical protein
MPAGLWGCRGIAPAAKALLKQCINAPLATPRDAGTGAAFCNQRFAAGSALWYYASTLKKRKDGLCRAVTRPTGSNSCGKDATNSRPSYGRSRPGKSRLSARPIPGERSSPARLRWSISRRTARASSRGCCSACSTNTSCGRTIGCCSHSCPNRNDRRRAPAIPAASSSARTAKPVPLPPQCESPEVMAVHIVNILWRSSS